MATVCAEMNYEINNNTKMSKQNPGPRLPFANTNNNKLAKYIKKQTKNKTTAHLLSYGCLTVGSDRRV